MQPTSQPVSQTTRHLDSQPANFPVTQSNIQSVSQTVKHLASNSAS